MRRMGEEIQEIYERFRKKFNLPEYNLVDSVLEISLLEGDKFLLRRIRNKIKEKLENYCEIIEELLHPDTTLAMMHECSFITDKTKNRIFNLYKKLMYMFRYASLLEIENKNEKDAKFINSFFKYLKIINREMKKIVRLRRNSWKKELSENIKAEYFG